jgi:DNA mismatch repair protein MutL
MPIQLLPEEVASQIAAGEVVERPASVVKELLENALDAQATQIIIHIEAAGKKLVEVSDDGFGIPQQELPLAVSRHATSKLARADDLFHIATLGFRGEALASIGSVSRMTVTSRILDADIAARLRVEGGHGSGLEAVGAPGGTTVRVEDLFYNVPARLKFLKHDQTERRHIDMLVTRYALAFPGVRFQLYQDGRSSLMTSGNGDRREVLAALYGAEIARKMLEVIAVDDAITITGFTSPVAVTRSNRREITFFVNKRPVQDITLTTALIQAYHTMLMVGRYPMAVIFLDMPSDIVDVNVHPTKAEVRFREPDRLFRAVQNSIRRALLAHTSVPELTKSPYWQPPEPVYTDRFDGLKWTDGTGIMAGEEEQESASRLDSEVRQVEMLTSSTKVPLLRLVGQVASAFIVAEGPDGLYLIDQHAAHERILFEKMMSQYADSLQSGSHISAQALLNPVTVELSTANARMLAEQIQTLGKLGFNVEEFGSNTFLVRSIPLILTGMDPGSALHVLVEEFEEDETPLQKEVEARMIARVCKRAAVKAGKSLSSEEQKALLNDLEACASPRTCPHGRPTMIHLSMDLLERQFGRRGAR